MNRMHILTASGIRRFFAVVALTGLWVLLTTSRAQAGCAVPYKAAAAPAIPFVSPHGEEEGKTGIVGL